MLWCGYLDVDRSKGINGQHVMRSVTESSWLSPRTWMPRQDEGRSSDAGAAKGCSWRVSGRPQQARALDDGIAAQLP